ncbi:MAG TPA: hypothetical protein VGC13_04500 [Longimicrobium sp.]|uniref:sacsin N-terminal ATP-binding-like domain-containing protein n=1 Tax=Longimicrobium sp. TaxID=2029185 RepID=UPI002EDA8411
MASTVPSSQALQRDPPSAWTGLGEKAQAVAKAAHALYWHGEPPSIEPDTPALARVAVEQLAADFKASPQAFVDALEGARAGAEVLSTDRLQGFSEIVQNADDAGASRVEFNFLPEELIVTHDGRPVNLRDVLALATPWLTTKRNEATAIGRFGIGLMTLQALSPALEVYSGPYSVRLESPSLAWIDPPAAAAATRASNITILRVPLSPGTLERDEIAGWIERWDDAALLFCASVEEVTLRVGGEQLGTLRLHWTTQDGRKEIWIGAASCLVHRRRAVAGDGRCWAVHTAEAPAPEGVRRSHKAHGQTTPLGVALPLTHADQGTVYAGLPLAAIGVPARIHGQFDPTSSRQGLAETSWNDALYPLAADLWTAAAARLFREQPAAAWSVIPLPEEDMGGGGTSALLDEILDRARTALARRAVIDTGGSERHLTELAVEVPALTGVITPDEVARLAGLPQALPVPARDAAERWREVLEDWRQADAPIPPEVDVEQALELLNEPGRGPDAVIALVAAAVEEYLEYALEELPAVVLADGSQVPPPAASDPWMLVTGEGGVGATLDITRALHPAYVTRSAPVGVVLKWLRRIGAAVDASDVAAVLERLARTGAAGGALQEALTDVQVVALRDALDQLSAEGRAKVGPGIGKAVLLQGFRFVRGGTREELPIKPAVAYLPIAIERAREPGFAEAAAETPGLSWLHGRYAKVLRSTGRASLGPLRFLQLLGAETAPRLRPHPKLAHRFVAAERGLPRIVEGGPAVRSRALSELGASYTLEDIDSPDLTAVLRSIAAERKPVQRRERAAAMLATLARAWERLSGRASVPAASDYYSWQPRGRTRAFWLWQAAEIPWLDDAKGTATAPHALQRRTPATVAVRGPAPTGYLHRDLVQHLKVLEALGVAGDPDTGTLVRALRDLRSAGTDDPDLPARTALIYRTLAERLGDDSRIQGDLPQAQIVAAFHEPPGLLFTNLGWHQPGGILTGAPIFGRWRAFTPSIQGADRLWTTLKLREPSAADSIDVLLRMGTAEATPDTDDQIVMLESLRLLVRNTAEVQSTKELARTLAKLPLWTSVGWRQRRPVYAVTDLPLADGLANALPIWRPGGDVSQFTPLFDALRLTPIPTESVRVIDPDQAEADEQATEVLRDAVHLLKEDLVRNDRGAAQRLTVSWEQLAELRVCVSNDLRVGVTGIVDGELVAPVAAKMDTSSGVLFLRNAAELDRVDIGGRAIAGLFRTEPRRIAQAWLAACQEARAGREAVRVRTAEEHEAVAKEGLARAVTELQRRLTRGEAQQMAGGGANGSGNASAPNSPPEQRHSSTGPVRSLIDPSRYQTLNPAGRVEGGNTASSKQSPASRPPPGRSLPEPRPGGAPPRPGKPAPAYTAAEREAVGLDLLRKVLARDDQEIVDLRGQKGLGADAVQLDREFWELKVYAGAEPDQITLQASQVQRAAKDEFFVVIVSNVEVADAQPRVRIIVKPLAQLRIVDHDAVRFTGVQSADSLVFDFGASD